jgi:hypothetical protein
MGGIIPFSSWEEDVEGVPKLWRAAQKVGFATPELFCERAEYAL